MQDLISARLVVAAITILASVGSASTATAAAENGARQLVEKTSEQYRAVKTEREKLEVLIVALPQKDVFTAQDAQKMVEDGGRGITHKRAVRQVLYAEDEKDKIHILFSLPPEDAGTGLLVWRQPAREQDNQWLYIPALKKARRVPVTSTQTFVGTNLIYEDVRELAGERTDRYTYENAGTDIVDGRDCSVVLAKPASDVSSAYGSRKIWIDKERSFPLKIEYYDSRDKLWKVLHNGVVKEVSPGIHRADLTEMRDLQINETTLLWITEREVGLEIPPEVFTRDYLQNPAEG